MPSTPVRVLVVEDDLDILALFDAGLTMRGFEVQTATNGKDGLAMLEGMTELPGVIVADLHMPVMNGWQFLTALSQDPRLAQIPVIVLTAGDDPAKSAPRPPTILIKPVAMDDLAGAISREAVARRE